MSSTLARVCVPVALFALTACASTSAPKSAPSREQLVEQRAQARWDLLVKRDFAKAYDFLSPGYRQLQSREVYEADFSVRPVKWSAAKVQTVTCPAQTEYCVVDVVIDYDVQSPLPGVGTLHSSAPLQERWVLSGDTWYHVPSEISAQ